MFLKAHFVKLSFTSSPSVDTPNTPLYNAIYCPLSAEWISGSDLSSADEMIDKPHPFLRHIPHSATKKTLMQAVQWITLISSRGCATPLLLCLPVTRCGHSSHNAWYASSDDRVAFRWLRILSWGLPVFRLLLITERRQLAYQ